MTDSPIYRSNPRDFPLVFLRSTSDERAEWAEAWLNASNVNPESRGILKLALEIATDAALTERRDDDRERVFRTSLTMLENGLGAS